MKKLLLGVICAGLLMGPLCGAEEEKENGPLVEKVATLNDLLAAREERASGEEQAEEEKQEAREEKQEAKEENQEAAEENQAVAEKDAEEERVENAIQFIRRHPGAEHHAMVVTFYGDFIELEDGSVWAVQAGDRTKVLDWRVSDVIALVPNYYWFANSKFCLINTVTNAVVEVDLYANPLTNSPYTLNIADIDYRTCRVYLSDNTYWMVPTSNRSTLSKWQIGDCVIIGTNFGIFADSYYPDILVNVTEASAPTIPGRYYQ